VNDRGEPTGFIIPDYVVSLAKVAEIVHAKSKRPVPFTDIGIVQRISSGKDESYIVPLGYTREQVNKITGLSPSHDNRLNTVELAKELKNVSWAKLFSEVRANNVRLLSRSSLWQPMKRVTVVGNDDPAEPDDADRFEGFETKLPIFIYTNPGNALGFDSDRLHREVLLRHMLAKESLEMMRSTLAGNPLMFEWLHDMQLAEILSRAQAELLMNSEEARPPVVHLVLNPDMSELILGPGPQLRPKPKWELERHRLKPAMKSWYSETNWDDPNILQIILHVGESTAMTSPEAIAGSVTSPAVTIVRDELGVHTLVTYLFHISTEIYGIEAANLDEVPASQIPEIEWRPASGRIPQTWWQTDSITKKVLWLATRNLCSHLKGEPSKVVCAVTPIGDRAIQVGMALGDREQGTPYAFAVVKDKSEVNAIPIFPTGVIEHQPDGSRVTRQSIAIKNYSVTTKGERRLAGPEQKLFDRPAYSAIIRGQIVSES
jgi:hypothetical protein